MGYLHHSRYLQYFEMGRIELLRAAGYSYADLARQGVLFVVTKVQVNYKAPARYDDEVTLVTKVIRGTTVRFDHAYELSLGKILLADGTSTIACVGPDGKVRAMPEALMVGE